MVKERAASGVVLVSSAAGSVTAEIEHRLREVFKDDQVLDFDPKQDFVSWLTPGAKVIVAGGDGTVRFLGRRLAGTDHPLAILPLGTFNNFASSLGIPTDLEAAIQVARHGRPTPATLGRVNGEPFLEAAAAGMFGAAITLGEATKDLTFGDMGRRLQQVAGARRFGYRLSGDLAPSGHALSLVFANTPSTGARLPVATTSPVETTLQLSLNAGSSHFDLLRRIVASLLRRRPESPVVDFRHLHLETVPTVDVYADSEAVGQTPVDIEAQAGGLYVLVPAS
jgi:diacylglycerol kinase family enzyme